MTRVEIEACQENARTSRDASTEALLEIALQLSDLNARLARWDSSGPAADGGLAIVAYQGEPHDVNVHY